MAGMKALERSQPESRPGDPFGSFFRVFVLLPFPSEGGEEDRGVTLSGNRNQDPENPLIPLSKIETWNPDEDIPDKRIQAPRCFNDCL